MAGSIRKSKAKPERSVSLRYRFRPGVRQDPVTRPGRFGIVVRSPVSRRTLGYVFPGKSSGRRNAPFRVTKGAGRNLWRDGFSVAVSRRRIIRRRGRKKMDTALFPRFDSTNENGSWSGRRTGDAGSWRFVRASIRIPLDGYGRGKGTIISGERVPVDDRDSFLSGGAPEGESVQSDSLLDQFQHSVRRVRPVMRKSLAMRWFSIQNSRPSACSATTKRRRFSIGIFWSTNQS